MNVSWMVLVAGLGLLSPTAAFAVDCGDDVGSQGWDSTAVATCAAETDAWVRLQLQRAQAILKRVMSRNPARYDARDQAVQRVLSEYLNLDPADYKQWLPVLMDELEKLRTWPEVKLVPPGGPGSPCSEHDPLFIRADRKTNTLSLCRQWQLWRLACRRQVLMREYFRLVGHEDFRKRKRQGFTSQGVLSRFSDAGYVAMTVMAIAREQPPQDIPAAELCPESNAVNPWRHE